MDLLMFNMSNVLDWQKGIRNRNYFVLRELLRQGSFEQVILVDFLSVLPVKRVFGKHRTWEYSKWWFAQQAQKTGLIHGLVDVDAKALFGVEIPLSVFSGLGYLTTSERALEQLSAALGMRQIEPKNLLVWSYDPFLPQVMELEAAKAVFDTVDNWVEHASYKKEAALLRSNYETIGKTADHVFTVSKGLTQLYPGREAVWVPNGIDEKAFEKAPNKPPRNTPARVGYVGTIQERVDFELVEQLCHDHADKQFLFYGPVWSGVQNEVDKLRRSCGNLSFEGRIPYDKLPAILAGLDAAIIPHRLDAFLESTNPMKMYDYLAAGKPVITTPGAGTEQFADLLSIEKTHEGFSKALDTAIVQDSPESIAQRKKRVKMHTWQNRVEQMLDVIS